MIMINISTPPTINIRILKTTYKSQTAVIKIHSKSIKESINLIVRSLSFSSFSHRFCKWIPKPKSQSTSSKITKRRNHIQLFMRNIGMIFSEIPVNILSTYSIYILILQHTVTFEYISNHNC